MMISSGVQPTGIPLNPQVTGGSQTVVAKPVIKLIIADDEASILRSYVRILGKHLGYPPEEIGTAADRAGALAVYAAYQSTVLAVVTDGDMPEVAPHNPWDAGLFLHDELRERGFTGPIAVVSAHFNLVHPRVTSRMFRYPETIFYQKPVAMGVLAQWLKGHGA